MVYSRSGVAYRTKDKTIAAPSKRSHGNKPSKRKKGVSGRDPRKTASEDYSVGKDAYKPSGSVGNGDVWQSKKIANLGERSRHQSRCQKRVAATNKRPEDEFTRKSSGGHCEQQAMRTEGKTIPH